MARRSITRALRALLALLAGVCTALVVSDWWMTGSGWATAAAVAPVLVALAVLWKR